MEKITVRLSTLLEKLEEMKKDRVDFVELDIVGRTVDCGQLCPAFINLQGIRRMADEYIVDYGSVDELSREDIVG